MIPLLLIGQDITKRRQEAEKILVSHGFYPGHPDLLWFETGEKLGVEQTKEIREFLKLKPYQAKEHMVVLLSAEVLTPEAQNTLLKTLEEPPGEATIILGAGSEEQLLSTILSRCQIQRITREHQSTMISEKDIEIVEKLLKSSIEERFKYVEKTDDKEKLLFLLIAYFRHKLLDRPLSDDPIAPSRWEVGYLKELVEAEKWVKQNVNARAILEYLMLKMPEIQQ